MQKRNIQTELKPLNATGRFKDFLFIDWKAAVTSQTKWFDTPSKELIYRNFLQKIDLVAKL